MKILSCRPSNNFATEYVGMQREIERMFDTLRGGSIDEGHISTWLPAIDVVENENEFVVKAEIPGIDKEDVKITSQDDVLTIRGEKKAHAEEKKSNVHRIERSYGVFQRSITFPKSVKSDNIEASYEKGILTITLPKVEEVKPKEIDVKVK